MLYAAIPLSVVLLGVIVYFALSRKSSRPLRMAALGALGAIVLSVLAAVIIIFAGMEAVDDEPVMPDFLAEAPVQAAPSGNFFALFLLAVFFVAFLAVVIFLSLRERKRQGT